MADLFLVPAQPQTFDQWAHLFTIKQFYLNIREGNIPVSWVDRVANYGYPLGQINQQLSNYFGALFFAFTQNIFLSYNLVALMGSIITLFFFYRFLRFYVNIIPAFVGTFLLNFAPYRILNIYVRGDLPEFIAPAFIAIILCCLTYWLKQNNPKYWLFLIISITGLALTHPIIVLVSFPLFFIYTLLLLSQTKKKRIKILQLLTAGLIGLGIASYYLLPLVGEIKYFYFGHHPNKTTSFEFLRPNQFNHEQWLFSEANSPGVRENRLQFGLIEFTILIIVSLFFLYQFLIKRNRDDLKIVISIYFVLLINIFLSTQISYLIWNNLTWLQKIQYPWRFLTSMQLLVPILLAFTINKLKNPKLMATIIILIICVIRFPQLYGKNYVSFPQTRYNFLSINMHNTIMNTIWSGNTLDYPIKDRKYDIIEGEGEIIDTEVKPTKRLYKIRADSLIRMIDYTFYFPGWKLFIDNKEYPIEFQDPNYRGVITYQVPQGTHLVELVYTDTKIRLLAKFISIFSLLLYFSFILFLKRNRSFYALLK